MKLGLKVGVKLPASNIKTVPGFRESRYFVGRRVLRVCSTRMSARLPLRGVYRCLHMLLHIGLHFAIHNPSSLIWPADIGPQEQHPGFLARALAFDDGRTFLG